MWSHVCTCPSTYIITLLNPGKGGRLLIIVSWIIPYLWNFLKIAIYFFYIILHLKFWAHSLLQSDIITILSKHTVILPIKYYKTYEKVLPFPKKAVHSIQIHRKTDIINSFLKSQYQSYHFPSSQKKTLHFPGGRINELTITFVYWILYSM